MDGSFWLVLMLVSMTAGEQFTTKTNSPDTTNTTSASTSVSSTFISSADQTAPTSADRITTVPTGTTVTTESTTIIPEGTTVTIEGPTVTPEGPTVTPEGTTLTPEGTTVTIEGTTVNTEDTTITPVSTTVTPVITTVTPVGSTITPVSTTVIPVSTTVTPIGSTITPVSTTVTPVGTISSMASTTTRLTTVAPLRCENGGIELNGVCICPDEWTGKTCSTGNACNATELEGFKFPRTPIGWFAYSEDKCPTGTTAAGKPKASTRCSSTDGSVSFSPPQVFQCDQTLSDIQQNLTSVEDLETLASSTQILTSRPEELTAENVTTAAQIANTLLLSPNATESIRVAAVATVSQLLNTSVPDSMEENDATQSLTQTLDQLSVNLSLSASQSQVVQPNLVIQSAQIQAADSQGVQFTSLTGTSGSFVADRIRLNTNTSEVVLENGFISEALIYIRFPSGEGGNARQKQSNVSLGFVLYQNDRFFPSRLYRKSRATIRVLSGSFDGLESSVVPQHVEMMFQPAVLNGSFLHDFSCVFWNYSLQDWSTNGCSKGNASDGVLRCFCNHTTNFAALWSFREKYEYAEALDVISIIGLSFSILGLVVTIIHHINENFYRKSRERNSNLNSKLALLSIYVSLLAFIITFLSGVQNSSQQSDSEVEVSRQNDILDSDVHVEPDRGSCTAVAALLHFFLLATFIWNSMYGTQLALLVRSMRRDLPPHWTPLSVGVGWGFPAVVMAITLAATYRMDDPLGYRQEEFCWLAALDNNKHFNFGKPMFWAFLLPVGLILIYNMVLLVLTSMTTCRVDPKLTSTSRSTLTKKFLVSFSLAVMLGLSWTLGYLVLATTGLAHLLFSIFFCLCTTTQGFQIFILFTARTPSFRAAMWRSVQYVSSVSGPLKQTKYNLWKTERETTSETYKVIGDKESDV
ncbi:adhesion G-protein coupled receptor G7 [Melanotaenia boesemani]|uniref:adhesion G-protein coupled receptor G7 n=1 Tax=Melanotaenia boesemani TaxID=1250792 RepID=UPI001C0566C2|nr:adhesion G-protein coupled receptor G7 [Melanotaenia boesemani]